MGREKSSSVELKPSAGSGNLYLGIFFITIAFFCAAVMSTFSKAASSVPRLLTLFLQYSISFLVFLPSGVKTGPVILKTEHFWLTFFGAQPAQFVSFCFLSR